MSIYLRGNIYWCQIPRKGMKPHRCSLKTSDRAVAQRLHDKIEAEVKAKFRVNELGEPVGKMTLQEAFEFCRKERPKWRDSKNFKFFQTNYNSLLSSYYFDKNMDIRSITPSVVSNYVHEQVADGYANNTINRRLSVLSSILQTLEGRLPELGVHHFRMLYKPKGKPRTRILRRDAEGNEIELNQIVETFRRGTIKYGKVMADFTIAIKDTAFRLSEMLRVNPSIHCDFNAQGFKYGSISCYENKSDHPRVIPMSKRVAEIMRRYPNGFHMLNPDKADYAWNRMKEELGLLHDKELVIHCLRHTKATELVRKKSDNIALVAYFMGHKSIKTTMGYVHLHGTDVAHMVDDEEVPAPKPTPSKPALVLVHNDLTVDENMDTLDAADQSSPKVMVSPLARS